MASDSLKELLIGQSADAELEREINNFERLASFIETENQIIDGEGFKPSEIPGQMQKIREDQVNFFDRKWIFSTFNAFSVFLLITENKVLCNFIFKY